VDNFYKEFGRLLRIQRNESELTQTDLAVRVGLSRTSVTNIELGRQQVPLHYIYTFATALGVSPEKLLPGRDFAVAESDLVHLPASASKELKRHELEEGALRWVGRVLKSHTENQGTKNDPKTEDKRSRTSGS
jgi:transcriptional regulator with XRE-family HTH domain